MNKKALIIGGSNGLGLELSKELYIQGYHCTVTGRDFTRKHELHPGAWYISLDLVHHQDEYIESHDVKVASIFAHTYDIVVYAAGFGQLGTLDVLSIHSIDAMVIVGMTAYAKIINGIIKNQGFLPKLVYISSTSGYVPRQLEPVYSGVKKGATFFSEALAEDTTHFGSVYVFAPAGMKTAFWRHDASKDMSGFLDPVIVAKEIATTLQYPYRFYEAKILRPQHENEGPYRVEVVKTKGVLYQCILGPVYYKQVLFYLIM